MNSLNLEILDSIRALQTEDEPDLLATLVALYTDSVPERISKIENAVVTKSCTSLEDEAHALKSSSANLGAEVMTKICRELELLGKEKTFDRAAEHLTALKEEFTKLKSEFESLPELQERNLRKAA